MHNLETEEEAKKSDNDEIFDVLNKFKNNIKVKTSDFDKKIIDKENEFNVRLNKWNSKLNKLNNNVKKLDNYIKEINDKKINIEKN